MTIHVRESAPRHATTTFQQQVQPSPVVLDERSGIGPHHLAIGKTRKLFEHGGTVFAFFSRGYEIACARIGADTSEIREIDGLDVGPRGQKSIDARFIVVAGLLIGDVKNVEREL